MIVQTYSLEVYGSLIFEAYEEIALFSACILNQHYPNTKAVVKGLTTTPNQLSKSSNMLAFWVPAG